MNGIGTAEQKLLSRDPAFTCISDLEVRSTGFKAGEWLTNRYSQEGENISPDVIWHNVPAGTEEIVLICEDPYAPREETYVHWIVYNIDPSHNSLPEDLNSKRDYKGILQGKNSAGLIGYIGAMPPVGHGEHFYHFQLFCINEKTALPAGVEFNQVTEKIKGKVIAQATFIGVYER